MTYENGGTVDDLMVYKLEDQEYLLVVNAANKDMILSILKICTKRCNSRRYE